MVCFYLTKLYSLYSRYANYFDTTKQFACADSLILSIGRASTGAGLAVSQESSGKKNAPKVHELKGHFRNTALPSRHHAYARMQSNVVIRRNRNRLGRSRRLSRRRPGCWLQRSGLRGHHGRLLAADGHLHAACDVAQTGALGHHLGTVATVVRRG